MFEFDAFKIGDIYKPSPTNGRSTKIRQIKQYTKKA